MFRLIFIFIISFFPAFPLLKLKTRFKPQNANGLAYWTSTSSSASCLSPTVPSPPSASSSVPTSAPPQMTRHRRVLQKAKSQCVRRLQKAPSFCSSATNSLDDLNGSYLLYLHVVHRICFVPFYVPSSQIKHDQSSVVSVACC